MTTPAQSDLSVPLSTPWYRRASVWLGIGINPASLSLGGGLATLIPLRDLLWLIPLGAVILTFICTAQGLIGRRNRQRMTDVAASTFGAGWGAGLISLLMAIGMVGWGGFQGGVSGASAAELFGLPGWAGALLVVGTLFTLTELGVNRWAALVWVTTSAAIALTIFALFTVDMTRTTTLAPETALASVTLREWLWVITTIVAYGTLFSLRNADFTWDMATDADVFKANLCLFVPFVFSVGVGALLFQTTGNWNIADILTQAQSAALGHLFLILAVVSPLLSGFYSGALALANVSPLDQRQSTFVICTLGFVLAATRFDQLLLPFLGILGASLGPALIVILVVRALPVRPSTASALVAWLGGAAVAISLQLQGQLLHTLLGALASITVLLGFYYVSSRGQDKSFAATD